MCESSSLNGSVGVAWIITFADRRRLSHATLFRKDNGIGSEQLILLVVTMLMSVFEL